MSKQTRLPIKISFFLNFFIGSSLYANDQQHDSFKKILEWNAACNVTSQQVLTSQRAQKVGFNLIEYDSAWIHTAQNGPHWLNALRAGRKFKFDGLIDAAKKIVQSSHRKDKFGQLPDGSYLKYSGEFGIILAATKDGKSRLLAKIPDDISEIAYRERQKFQTPPDTENLFERFMGLSGSPYGILTLHLLEIPNGNWLNSDLLTQHFNKHGESVGKHFREEPAFNENKYLEKARDFLGSTDKRTIILKRNGRAANFIKINLFTGEVVEFDVLPASTNEATIFTYYIDERLKDFKNFEYSFYNREGTHPNSQP